MHFKGTSQNEQIRAAISSIEAPGVGKISEKRELN